MPAKSSSSSPKGGCCSSKSGKSCGCNCGAGFSVLLKYLVIVLSVLAPIFYALDKQLERFYVFDLDQLREVSAKGIALHGNDTRAIVQHIVGELAADPKVSRYVNTHEDWVFNNAGGAMGAMYIIHASAFNPPSHPLFNPYTNPSFP
jgi:C-8 sterol isomerase